MSLRVGYFGKLPARGDFLRAGLSRAVTQAWHDWLQAVLPAARAATGEAWMSARGWRFAFAPGICGPGAVTGLFLPSADKVGRVFPLLIAAEAAPLAESFQDCAERLGRAAIDGDIDPGTLAARLADASCEALARPTQGARWWRPGVTDETQQVLGDALPDADAFARMLTS